MSEFRELIATEAKNVRELHEAIHATFKRRGESQAAMNEWSNACTKWQLYESQIQDWLEILDRINLSTSVALKDFALTFLEMDPMYFRSGYIKERLLQRLKSVDLDQTEVARITAVLVDAVRNRGQREFRRYCRLAAALQRPEVLEEATRLSESPDRCVASRAKMMLQYLQSANPQKKQ